MSDFNPTLTVPKAGVNAYSVEGRLGELDNVLDKLDSQLSQLFNDLSTVLTDTGIENKAERDTEPTPPMSLVTNRIDNSVGHCYSMLFRVEEIRRSLNL